MVGVSRGILGGVPGVGGGERSGIAKPPVDLEVMDSILRRRITGLIRELRVVRLGWGVVGKERMVWCDWLKRASAWWVASYLGRAGLRRRRMGLDNTEVTMPSSPLIFLARETVRVSLS